ncbi:hypothetical protein QQ045_017885 [Rhodiola kirilowii]
MAVFVLAANINDTLYVTNTKFVNFSSCCIEYILMTQGAVIQDIDTSLNSKSSKFRSYSTSPAKQVENQILKMYFPDDDMRFDEFDSRFRGTICGKKSLSGQ